MGSKRTRKEQRGYTLIELVMVITIIGILAAIAVRTIISSLENARFNATVREMVHLVWAITGNPELVSAGVRADFGYVGDTGVLPPNLDALITDPGGICGWDGPYIEIDFEQNPNDYKMDSWGVLYSYGVGGTGLLQLTSDSAGTKTIDDTTDILQNTVQVQLLNADGNPLDDVTGSITIAYGCGSSSLTFDESSEKFVINTAPIGVHLITAIASGYTTFKTVSVLPGSDLSIDMSVFPSFGALSVTSCAAISGTGNEVVSLVVNNGGSPEFIIDKLTPTWTNGTCWECETPFLEEVVVGGTTYWQWNTNGRSARVGSGTQIVLDDVTTLNSGNTTIELTFNNSITGTGQAVDMSAVDFTLKLFQSRASAQTLSFEACGTACSNPSLSFVSGSASVYGTGNEDVDFDVSNSGSLTFPSNQMFVTWANSSCWNGTPYLESVAVGPTEYWNYVSDGGDSRAGSGQILTLSSSLDFSSTDRTINMTFQDTQEGSAGNIDMSDTDFTLNFKSACFDDQPISLSTAGSCAPCLLRSPAGTASGTGPADVDVNMINSGTSNCNISLMKITCSTTGTQPWVEAVVDGGTTFWDATTDNAGARGNTTSGAETILILASTMTLGSGTIDVDRITFFDSVTGGAEIDMRGVTVTIEYTLTDCPDCTSPQTLTFVVN